MTVNVGDLVATTLRNVGPGWADNVTSDNALLHYLKKRGNVRKYAGGGRTIDEAVLHGSNSSVQFYSGYDTFTPPTTGQEVIDLASFNWKQLGGFVAISGLETVQNMEENRRKDWLKARMEQLKANLENTFATSCYSSGTGSGGKELGGLGLLVDDDPTSAGTIGGIDQVANSFWRNQYSAAAATTSSNIKSRMNSMWLATKRGADKVDLILADDVMYTYYWESLQDQVRFKSSEKADAGFDAIAYKSADVLHDGECTSKHMYFLNTKYLAFRYAPGHWFQAGEKRKVTNADYDVIPMFVMGNFTISNRARQGVIIDD